MAKYQSMKPGLAGALAALLVCICVAAARAEPVQIVAFGDSNTAGFRVLEKNAYPAQLERALRAKGHDVHVLNSGVSGNTSGMGLSRIDKAVPPGTQIAIVYFGRNDLRWGVEPAKFRANVEEIVKRLRARDIKVLLIGLRTFSLADIAAANGAVYYPDFFAGVSHDGEKDPKYTLIFDPIQHLNAEGYGVVVSKLAPIVETMLARRESADSQAPTGHELSPPVPLARSHPVTQ
ncbi:MAG TPA: GDSL-type esterase/lipase family protein [Xanthobacteraceae bacterium]|nr:GDSL-type esterase/lipase family protein [Xanthobacteraceae bacterium]